MNLKKNSCHRIAALVFLASTLGSIYVFQLLKFTNILSMTGGLFTGAITAGIWLEVSYRFLVKEATAPLDRLIEKI
jgi:hypothetical protein